MSETEVDTSRVVVQTYVPAYQRDEWDEHAEELGMNRSEFVRTMVQAGRRGFGANVTDRGGSRSAESDSQEGPSGPDKTTGRHSVDASRVGEDESGGDENSLEPRVVEVLADAGCLSWDELLAEVTDDIETRLEATLQRLQEENSVRYSGPRGGYVLDAGAKEGRP